MENIIEYKAANSSFGRETRIRITVNLHFGYQRRCVGGWGRRCDSFRFSCFCVESTCDVRYRYTYVRAFRREHMLVYGDVFMYGFFVYVCICFLYMYMFFLMYVYVKCIDCFWL